MSDVARLTEDLARRLGAERIHTLSSEPEGETAMSGDGPQGALIVCDGPLEATADPEGLLARLRELLEAAPAALLSIGDRDLLAGVDGRPARWNATELLELLERCELEPAWVGLTDARGSVGRRAGITCVLSPQRHAEVRAALAAGPLSLDFDRAVEPRPAAGRTARVCIASYEIVGPTRTGGIGTAYTSLAEALAEEGHRVTVLFTGWEEPSREPFRHWVRRYRSKGIDLQRLPQPTATWIETGHRHAVRAYEVYRWLRDRDQAEPFDVLHFPEVLGHGLYCVSAQRLGLAFERTTIAIGTHSSTSWVLEANGSLFQALDDFADDFIERRSVAGCDALISPSAYMLDWMRNRDWQLPPRHFVQQYAGTRAVGAPEARTRAPEPAEADGQTELVFFGRLEPRKGLRVFCDALDLLAAESPDCRITFLGKQASIDGIEAGDYVRERAESWPWRTKLIDDLGQPEAIAYLRAPGRRLTVIPSLADNSPNTVYEALALRIPFIASRVGGTAELIDPRDLGRATFDPMSGLPRGSGLGAEALASRLGAALYAERLEAPRATVDADSCREAHVRWHAAVAAVGRSDDRVATRPPRISACIIGSDPARIGTTRRSLEAGVRKPYEVIDAPEPAAARPSGDVVLFLPAGGKADPGAIETIERATTASDAEVIAVALKVRSGEHGALTRVPVGGPAIAGLLRRCFGDAAFMIRRETLEHLGGFDPGVEAADQAHHLLCRVAIAEIAVEVLPEPIVTDVPVNAVGNISIVEAAHKRTAILDAYNQAPPTMLAQLPILTQQLYATASERERQFVELYENRFGRLTLPIRRSILNVRRVRRALALRGRAG